MITTEERLEAKVSEMTAKVFVGDYGWYRVYNSKSHQSYWVHLEMSSCTCRSLEDDYYGLGTCKHIEFAREMITTPNDGYCEFQAVFNSPSQAHSFSSMVLGNKKLFHSVWVELVVGSYVVHYKSYKSKKTRLAVGSD